jgi:hypothetical protein
MMKNDGIKRIRISVRKEKEGRWTQRRRGGRKMRNGKQRRYQKMVQPMYYESMKFLPFLPGDNAGVPAWQISQ